MGDFGVDTAVAGGNGSYRARLSAEWEVWGPLGGYIAAVALRALGAESALPRPATFQCLFLAPARFDQVEIRVETVRRGRRSEALTAQLLQDGRPVLVASGWTVPDAMPGFDHRHGAMPEVPSYRELASYSALAENFDEWFAVWKTCIDGRPVRWSEEPGPPLWHAWMRLLQPADLSDPFLEAARSLMWMDLMMWNAATPPHLPWPVAYIAPNLDVAVCFHDAAPAEEWLLCDAHAPVARDGLVGCSGRVWSPDGRLVASGSSTLFCRPNPMAEQG